MLSLQCVIPRPRWLWACFMGKAQLCNFYSLEEHFSAVPANLLAQGLTKQSLSEPPECRASLASGEQRGWPQFLHFLQCAHTAYVTPVCSVSPEPGGWQEICPEVWNRPLTERTFRMRMYNEMTGEPRKYPEKPNYETKVSSEVWHPKSFPSLLQRGFCFL